MYIVKFFLFIKTLYVDKGPLQKNLPYPPKPPDIGQTLAKGWLKAELP